MRSDVEIRVPNSFNLFLLGDMQWGNVGTYERGLDAAFAAIHSEYEGCKANIVCIMGDVIDAVSVADVRFSIDSVPHRLMQLRAQIEHAISRLSEIRGKVAVVLKGNHEQKWVNSYGEIGAEIAAALRAEYGHYCCTPTFISRTRREILFRAFLHHGFGKLTSSAKDSVQARANVQAALKNRLQHLYAGAAVMAMGHTHQLLCVAPENSLQITSDPLGGLKQVYPARDGHHTTLQRKEIVPPESRWYINTGSFLRLYTDGATGYAEIAGYRPTEMGYAVVVVRDGVINGVRLETV